MIVVDDGSSDESSKVMDIYSNRVLILKQANSGVTVVRNNGILHSSGTFVALCDSDDFWEPEKIEKQLQLILSDRRLILVGSSIRYFSNDTYQIGSQSVSKKGDLAKDYRSKPGVAWIPNAPSSALFYKSDARAIGLLIPS